MAFKSNSLPDQQESFSFIHPSCIQNMYLHQAFDSFQSVSRTVNNGAASVIGKKIFLSSIRKPCCRLPQPSEIGTIIRKGQLTCRHYWWSVADTSLMLALAFSLSSGSCQERLLVSQSPCQQGGYIWAPQWGHIIAAERDRANRALLLVLVHLMGTQRLGCSPSHQYSRALCQ